MQRNTDGDTESSAAGADQSTLFNQEPHCTRQRWVSHHAAYIYGRGGHLGHVTRMP